MNRFQKILYFLAYRFRLCNSVTIAKKIGVKCGAGCRFLDDPMKMFGTEPYLITIGEHVELTNGTRLVTHDGGMWVLRKQPTYQKSDYFSPINIGNNVFVGLNTIILPGVTIGDNVVIGACSVVTKDIPSNTVAAGVPAKPIKDMSQYLEKAQIGAIATKGMSFEEKKKAIQRVHPEWFAQANEEEP